jgi:hypothetical protein
MGALLIRNPKIMAGLSPFMTMRGNPATTMAMTGHQMSQLM